jgi:FlaA1/EpsC-like NDP-sugar epimerase
LAQGGEVFVTNMPVARITDLAKVMVRELAPGYGFAPDQIEIKVIGSKPGEKLYEELMNEEETRRTVELPRYFVVLPAFKSVYKEIDYDYPELLGAVERPYNSSSAPAMTQEGLRHYLLEHQLLNTGVGPINGALSLKLAAGQNGVPAPSLQPRAL